MSNYDVIKIETQPNLTLSVWFRDGLDGKIRFLPEHLTGVLQPLAQQETFECAYLEDNVVRWPNNLDISPQSMYRAVETKQQVGCICYNENYL